MNNREWGARSTEVFLTLDPRLQLIMNFVLNVISDLSLLEGHRKEEDQNEYYRLGTSQVRWPDGAHNSLPSRAVDFQPYPMPNINATDPAKRQLAEKKLWGTLGLIAGAAKTFALANGFRIRWGGDWNGNGNLTDQTFDDLFHIELVDD